MSETILGNNPEDIIVMHRMLWNIFGICFLSIVFQYQIMINNDSGINAMFVVEELSSDLIKNANFVSVIIALSILLGIIALYLASVAIVGMIYNK